MTTRPLRIIGVLRSCYKEKFGTPRQAGLAPDGTATLAIVPEQKPEQSLAGLEKFSHVWLLSYLHLNTNKRVVHKVHPPRLRGGTIGVFASRSPHRPNQIGLSVARLVKIEGDTLHLSGLDLIDGTPIVDVKPYMPEADCILEATRGWTGNNPFPALQVAFNERASADIVAAEKRLGLRGLQPHLTDILRHDIRNPRDRAQRKEGLELGFFLYDFEARFSVRAGTATLLRLETGKEMHRNPRRNKT